MNYKTVHPPQSIVHRPSATVHRPSSLPMNAEPEKIKKKKKDVKIPEKSFAAMDSRYFY